MADLRSIQQAMACTILGQDPDELLTLAIKSGPLQPADRLRIHQNNFRESLSDALLGLFPLCKAFVGEVFLKQALRHFVTDCPPGEAALYRYGSGVADFLQTYPAAKTVPYLADVARLEWYTHKMANAEELPAFDDPAAALAALRAGPGLRLHDNARLLSSGYPIYDLWRVATEQCAPEDISMENGGQAILLVLHQGQVFYQALDEDIAQVLTMIENGENTAPIAPELLEELIDRGAVALAKTGQGRERC